MYILIILDKANNLRANQVDYKLFYNENLNDRLDIKEDFPRWKANDSSFCSVPFILKPNVKSEILKVESMVQMRHELQDAFFRAIFRGITSPYLVIEVRREFIIRDALYQVSVANFSWKTRQVKI